MSRTRIATGIAALAVAAASVTLVVPATFANGRGASDCAPSACAVPPSAPLPGTEEPESYDIGTPPTVEGDVDLGGGDAPVTE